MPISHIKFNCIIVIQSMEDPKPGEEIVKTINYAAMRKGLENYGQLHNVRTKRELYELLWTIYYNCKFSNCKPFIHFEMHGTKEGIKLTGGAHIPWKELEIIMREINIETKNHLFVSLSTCYGGHFYSAYSHRQPCSFFGYVGTLEKAGIEYFEIGYQAFFETLLTTGSIGDAVIALNKAIPEGGPKYIFVNCFQFYEMLIEHASKNFNLEEERRRMEEYAREHRHLYPNLDDNQFKRFLQERLKGVIKEAYIAQFRIWQKEFLHLTPPEPDEGALSFMLKHFQTPKPGSGFLSGKLKT